MVARQRYAPRDGAQGKGARRTPDRDPDISVTLTIGNSALNSDNTNYYWAELSSTTWVLTQGLLHVDSTGLQV